MFSRGCSALWDALTCTSTVRWWGCAQEHTKPIVSDDGRRVLTTERWKLTIAPTDSVFCQRWAKLCFFWRFVVYLLPQVTEKIFAHLDARLESRQVTATEICKRGVSFGPNLCYRAAWLLYDGTNSGKKKRIFRRAIGCLNLTGVQCEKGFVHGGWQCLTVVGLFCGKHPPEGEGRKKKTHQNISKKAKNKLFFLMPPVTERQINTLSQVINGPQLPIRLPDQSATALIPTWKIACQNIREWCLELWASRPSCKAFFFPSGGWYLRETLP